MSRAGKRQKKNKTHRHALWNAHTVIEKGTNGQACTSHTRRHCCSAPIRARCACNTFLIFSPSPPSERKTTTKKNTRKFFSNLLRGIPRTKVRKRTETFSSKKTRACVQHTRIVLVCVNSKRFFQLASLYSLPLSQVCEPIPLKLNCAKSTLAHLHSMLCQGPFSLFDGYHSGAAV